MELQTFLKSKYYLIFFSLFCYSLLQARNIQKVTIIHNGLKRNFLMYNPCNNNHQNKDRSLLIVLHGGHGTARGMIRLTYGAFNKLAEKENWIVIYPNAIDKKWNDGRQQLPNVSNIKSQTIDDVSFISTLIDLMIQKQNVDPTRVYVTGMSNGAIMTERLCIELSKKITAGASRLMMMYSSVLWKYLKIYWMINLNMLLLMMEAKYTNY